MADLSGDDDGGLRQRVLMALCRAVNPDGYSDQFDYGIYPGHFCVTRTVDRKGYRHEQSFTGEHAYNGEPRVRVSIELEFEDDALGTEFIEILEILSDRERAAHRAALEKKRDEARDAQAKAKADYIQAQTELNRLDGISSI